MIECLVEDNAWASLAEVVWAESLISGDSGRLLGAIADHSETGPYLEQVQVGPFQVEDDENAPTPEGEGEAAELIGRIRRIAEALDIDHLNQRDLLTLSRDASRLADIAKARNLRDRDVSLQRVQVEEWETRHAKAIAGAAMLENFPAALRARIDRGGMDRESVTAALDLAERLLSIDTRYRETHEQLNRASSEEDFASVSSLAEALQSLRIERDDLGATIDNALADPQPDNTAVGIDVERVSRISEYWRANWGKVIDRIDRENRSRAATRKIVGSARLSLGGKVEQALTFCDRWLSLIRECPDERPPFHREQAAILRASVNDNAGQALAEIEAVAKTTSTPAAVSKGTSYAIRRSIFSAESVGSLRRASMRSQNAGLVSRTTVSQSLPSTPRSTAAGSPRRVTTTRSCCAESTTSLMCF